MGIDDLIKLFGSLGGASSGQPGAGITGSVTAGSGIANSVIEPLLQQLVSPSGNAASSVDSSPGAKSLTETLASAVGGSSVVGAVASVSGLAGGLTLLPIIGGLLKLFGGGGEKELPPLEEFSLPESIRAEAALDASGSVYQVDRGAGDRLRALPAPLPGTQPALATGSSPTAANAVPAAAQVTVNIQAMDSQSFMDRREDIARAVREAMLQAHSLNDVVSEI